MTADIDIIKKYHPNGKADELLNSFIFVTNIFDSSFSGYTFDGIFREDLSYYIEVE